MLQNNSKQWTLGIDAVMKQINDSPHLSLPVGITPNIVMFGRTQRTKHRDLLSNRGVVITISKETIDRICDSETAPDPDDPDINAVELAIEISIQYQEADTDQNNGGVNDDAEVPLEQNYAAPSSPHLSLSHSPSQSNLSQPFSPKGKAKAVEMTVSDGEAGTDPELQAEEEARNAKDSPEGEEEEEAEEAEEEELIEREDLHPNARKPVNDAVQTLEAQIVKHQDHQREKMQKKYNASHAVVVFKEGDYASLAIPKENRAPTDNLRMSVKVLEAPHRNRYRVQSKYGIIKGLVSTTSLNVVPEHLVTDLRQELENSPTKEVTLSQAAAHASNTTYIALSCNCKKRCNKRCRCVKNSKLCSQYCHKSDFDCGNLPNTIVELTEAQLIPRAEFEGLVNVSLLIRLCIHKLTIMVLQGSEKKACYNDILYKKNSIQKSDVLKISTIVRNAVDYKSKSKS